MDSVKKGVSVDDPDSPFSGNVFVFDFKESRRTYIAQHLVQQDGRLTYEPVDSYGQ